MNSEKLSNLLESFGEVQLRVSVLKTRLESFQQHLQNQVKLFNHGSLDMEKLRQLASGSEDYQTLNQLQLCLDETLEYIAYRQDLIDGENALELTQE